MKKYVKRGLGVMASILPVLGTVSATQAGPAAPLTPWETALKEDCVASYSRFILEHPESEYVEEARCRIETMQSLEQNLTAAASRGLTHVPDGGLAMRGAARLQNI